ncbi:MAG TPA: FixH family protein [Acidimicrobiales bacterium]|nr:FixH family protein [Acidimicrobiales bacterium]
MAVRNIWRLSIVFVVGVAAFVVAINKLNQPPFSSCEQASHPDPTYSASIDEDPSVVLTKYHLTVTQNGQPVDRAQVCMRADMGGAGGMSGMGVTSEAVPLAPGKYEVPVRFVMGGPWQGAVLVQRQGADTVEVPIHINVLAL